MTHGSLFSGIGGFDLAAKWMGWENVFHVEKDPFCQRILAHHFPESKAYDDITTFDATPFRGRIRVLSGGFPCQPFSAAGKRAGTSDDRYLWPEMFRIIREARPTFVVAENVRGLLSWNEGLVLDTVCADLESEGYEVLPAVLPAASVNAPHRRDRIWIVAHRPDSRCEDRAEQHRRGQTQSRERQPSVGGCGTWSNAADAPNAECVRREGRGVRRDGLREETREGQIEVHGGGGTLANPNDQERERGSGASQREGQEAEQGGDGVLGAAARLSKESDATNSNGKQCADGNGKGTSCEPTQPPNGIKSPDVAGKWETFPTFPPVCGGDDGLPQRLDGITFSKWRTESIKAYGNAIVPQVAYQIFQALEHNEFK